MLVLNSKVLSEPATNEERLRVHGRPVLGLLRTLAPTMLLVCMLPDIIVISYNEATRLILTAGRLDGTA